MNNDRIAGAFNLVEDEIGLGSAIEDQLEVELLADANGGENIVRSDGLSPGVESRL